MKLAASKAHVAVGSNVAHKGLIFMMSFPVMVVTLVALDAGAFHWTATFYCTTIGVVLVAALSPIGLLLKQHQWVILVLELEIAFGMVPMAYLFLDDVRVEYHSTHEVGPWAHRARIIASIPVVIMAKQFGRSAIDLIAEPAPPTWWHSWMDIMELLIYFTYTARCSHDAGELWMLIYTSLPVGVFGFWIDHTVLRVRSLARANERLMYTSFAGTVRVDGNGRVSESNHRFDLLVDGDAEGLHLDRFFTANKQHLQQLCSTVPETQRYVRRVRTTMVSLSNRFFQDVELRVLAPTEEELRSEQGLLLGLALMGERTTIGDGVEGSAHGSASDASSSAFMEQYLDDSGNLHITKSGCGEQRSCLNDARYHSGPPSSVPEEDISPFDSVSQFPGTSGSSIGGLRRRPRRQRHAALAASAAEHASTASSFSGARNSNQDVQFAANDAVDPDGDILSFEERAAFPAPWTPPADIDYLEDCCMSTLEDVITSLNYKSSSCCHWHANLNRLSRMVQRMRRWKECSEVWPTATPQWQCGACSALQFEENVNNQCWLCFSSIDDKADPES